MTVTKRVGGSEADLPAVLFHGTSILRVEDWISCEGLRPQKAAPGIYLTDSLHHAEGYAGYAVEIDADRHGPDDGNAPAILVVDLSLLEPAAFGPDDYELADALARGNDDRLKAYRSWKDVPWHVSLAVSEQMTYAGRIPWEAITLARTTDEARRIADGIAAGRASPAP